MPITPEEDWYIGKYAGKAWSWLDYILNKEFGSDETYEQYHNQPTREDLEELWRMEGDHDMVKSSQVDDILERMVIDYDNDPGAVDVRINPYQVGGMHRATASYHPDNEIMYLADEFGDVPWEGGVDDPRGSWTGLNNQDQSTLGHELVHYLDDMAQDEITDGKSWGHDKKQFLSDQGRDYDMQARYWTPLFVGGPQELSLNRSPDVEALAYYTSKSEQGWDYTDKIINKATDMILDGDSVNQKAIADTKVGWGVSLGGGVQPAVDRQGEELGIKDIVRYIEDREAVWDVWEVLRDKYLTEEGKELYYQR
jgi:hypothetical protein